MKINRTTGFLVACNCVLSTALAWALLCAEPDIQWGQTDMAAPAPIKPATVPRLAELPSGERAVAWQHPLFSPDRQPDLSKNGPLVQQLDGVRLTGVIVDGTSKWALLRLASQRNVKLKQGDALDGGWALSQVDVGSATFQRQGQTHTLKLLVPRLPVPVPAPLMTLPHVTSHD
jgi:general secretion pathway protein N